MRDDSRVKQGGSSEDNEMCMGLKYNLKIKSTEFWTLKKYQSRMIAYSLHEQLEIWNCHEVMEKLSAEPFLGQQTTKFGCVELKIFTR